MSPWAWEQWRPGWSRSRRSLRVVRSPAVVAGRPLLLFHGDRDEILPMQASEVVRSIAGTGDLVVLPGDGHLLAKSGDALMLHLERWLPTVLVGNNVSPA